jgi:AbrB family looped-hinge helix DNA binding protein
LDTVVLALSWSAVSARRASSGKDGISLKTIDGYRILLVSYIGFAMPHPDPLLTTVSTKGQVILPKSIRQRRNWDAGTRLVVEDTPEGILLRQAPAFAPTAPDQVFGLLATGRPPVSLEDMDAAILTEARARHDRD